MIVSDITIDLLKNYLRVEGDDENALLEAILAAAKQYAMSYTGLDSESLDKYQDIPLAVLALAADMYDVRQATVDIATPNITTKQILDYHSANLLHGGGFDV